MRRPASQAQLELPLAAVAPPEAASPPEPVPALARLCARCGWYCPRTAACPVCHTPAPTP